MESAIDGFINIKDWLPHDNKPIIIKTKYGVREAVGGKYLTGAFHLTDCTHPMQNTYMNVFDVTEWKYVNDEDAENLLFRKNTWMRSIEADGLLRSIKSRKTVFNKIYQWLIKVIK